MAKPHDGLPDLGRKPGLNNAPRPPARTKLGREEQRYLLTVAVIVLMIFIFRRQIQALTWFVSLSLPGILSLIVMYKVMTGEGSLREVLGDQLTLVPFMRAEGEKKAVIPKVTILLILLNVLVHYVVKSLPAAGQESVYRNFCFLPEPVTWWNFLPSLVSSLFLHGSDGHLWGNMVFLWAFGPAVEERLGAKKFIFYYLLTGVLGSLTAVFFGYVSMQESIHGLGASGAISGIMGVFMVRCYFKRLVIPLPIFGPVSYRLRINSLVPMGYFFLLNVKGGAGQLAGSDSSIGYWAHIGSLIAGVLIALRSRHYLDAAREKYVAIGIDAMENPAFHKDGEGALRRALEFDPENETALLALARKNAVGHRPEGREQFEKVIAARLKIDAKGAAELYKEYLAAYNLPLSPTLQYRLAGILYRSKDLQSAMRALETLIDGNLGDAYTREQAYSQLVPMLVEAGLPGPARHRLEQLAAAFPQSPLLPALRQKVPVDAGHGA